MTALGLAAIQTEYDATRRPVASPCRASSRPWGLDMDTKFCASCGTSFTRRGRETRTRFARRSYCSLPCGRSGPPLVERFWAKVDRRGPGECWPWTGATTTGGYGRLEDAGRPVKATHVSLDIAGRPIPRGMSACHTCDNPPCVNPAHLWSGTQTDNTADMFAKGRGNVSNLTHPLQTVCKRGHSMADAIVAVPPRRGRICKVCRDLRNRARRWVGHSYLPRTAVLALLDDPA